MTTPLAYNIKKITERKYSRSRRSSTPLSREMKWDRKPSFSTRLTSHKGAHPEITAAKLLLRQNGALGALMSGSGSSVFGLFSAEQKAKRALAALPQRSGWRYFAAPLLV